METAGEAINNVLEFKELQQNVRWYGSRCTVCGTVQFPRSRLCVNPECKSQDTQTAVSFIDRPARVLSHTSDFAVGCYCADESRCHRSLLKTLIGIAPAASGSIRTSSRWTTRRPLRYCAAARQRAFSNWKAAAFAISCSG